MDSLSQFALGAAVSVAVMGRRTAVWKAALWGGALGTLPDLDALIDHGDPVLNMVLHRAETHALFWQTLASVPLAAGITAWMSRGQRTAPQAFPKPTAIPKAPGEALAEAARGGPWSAFPRWLLTVWLVLVTHALLDGMTIYGTQLALPFSAQPYGLGSIFIIDPLYTLPLLLGLGAALWARGPSRGRWNLGGLALSTAYLAWSALAQHHVTGLVRSQLAASPGAPPVDALLVTPAPLNTVLWRIVLMRPDSYEEGFRSLLDGDRPIRFTRYPRDRKLYEDVRSLDAVARIAAFSQGFFRLDERDRVVRITDLRMGQEPAYAFSFAVAQRGSPLAVLRPSVSVGGRGDIDLAAALRWLWRRAGGEDLDPPGSGDAAARVRSMTCDVAYLPERSTWQRQVRLQWAGGVFLGLDIDGQAPHAVSLQGAALATALDNERIQLDLDTMEWASDFRGLASGKGRCAWTP